MAIDRFLIAPYDDKSGLRTNVRPWLIPDQAFSSLSNAYVYRGRVRKRFGSRFFQDDQLLSRFRVQIDTTDGNGDTTGGLITPVDSGASLIVTPAVGQMFSIGSEIFTVNALGAPATMLISGSATSATFNTTTGAVAITGAAAATAVYYYPCLPVMGLRTYESDATNTEPTIGFDTSFAYSYATATGWTRISTEATPDAAFWTGDDTQFFWSCTWTGSSPDTTNYLLFVTNFNENEALYMRYYDGTQWETYRPVVNTAGGNFLESARILVPFKNRLLAFNTWENETAGAGLVQYPARVRWTQVGSPLAANAWYQDTAGLGGGLDAPTTESIIAVEFIRDRLIVFFERSTYELVYTGNQVYPFAWQLINTELGAESTFSIVPFDRVALGVGNNGIHACNGINVDRIDDEIPDVVFAIHNQNAGVERVYGVRDFFTEMVYWSLPDVARDANFPFPNRVLTFNYKTGTWAFNDDSITCFGYYQPTTSTALWSATDIYWSDDEGWGSGQNQALFQWVTAGNQEGFTFLVDPEITTNASALQITDIVVTVAGSNIITVTCVNHNLREGDFIYIQDVVDTVGNMTLLNDKIFKVIDNATYSISANAFSFTYSDSSGSVIAGTYAGAGLIARVSNIVMRTKQYNFYAAQARNASINKVDFMVDRTGAGEIDINYYVGTAQPNLLEDSQAPPLGTGALVGTGTLETFAYPTVPFEATATRVWHPIYIQADGEVIQLEFKLNDEQMMDTDIRQSDFQLHAMAIYAQPTSFGFR